MRERMVDTSNGDTSMPANEKLCASLASSLYNSDNHKSFKQIKERHIYLIPICFVGPVPIKKALKGEGLMTIKKRNSIRTGNLTYFNNIAN